MPLLWIILLVAALGAGTWGCGSPAPAAVADSLQVRVEALSQRAGVRGERLLEPKAVARFYEARGGQRAWGGRAAERVVEAIVHIEEDGLTPSDYHLETIQRLLEERDKQPSAALEADLDLLLTDAVAGMVDDLRYGRVLPVSLNRRWNVDPRDDAPSVDSLLAGIASRPSVQEAIEAARPRHFIYQGLVRSLGRLRQIADKGGWPTVPQGKAIRPGASDPRLAAVRRRLAIGGELRARAPQDSARYDNTLLAAVKLFQARHRIEPTGVIDKATVDAMNVSASVRASQVRVNLERARWVLHDLNKEFMLVNLPAFKAYLIRGGRNIWETRTQIGEEARQTPSFRATMRSIVFNPDWTVPPTILAEDVLEGMRRGEDVIAQKNLTILDAEGNVVDPGSIDWYSATPETFPYTLRQPPGPDNALGRMKFLFPNKHSIYLHDTPSRSLFEADRRTFSSGCIRIERPFELAELLLQGQQGWTPEKIRGVVAEGETHEVKLARPVPILIVYWTVSVGASGEVRFARDVYELDPPLLAALDRPTT